MDARKLVRVAVCCFFCCLCSCFAENDDVIAKLVARIDELERQGKHHETLINGQRKDIDALRSIVQGQKEKLSDHEATIRELQERREAHQKISTPGQSPQVIDDIADQVDVENHSATIETVKGGLRRNSRIVMEGPVAFHAVIPDGEHPHLGQNQKIVFDHVLNNLGGGYHNQHGLFIAPAAGVYIFSTSILSYTHNTDSLHVTIMKNGVILGAAYAHGDSSTYDQGSVSVVTQLATGDDVWVSHRYGSTESIWGDYYSSFMGCLIMYV